MIIRSKRKLISTISQRWQNAFQRRDVWFEEVGPSNKAQISQRLSQLSPDASEDQIATAIGDARWTQNPCYECGADSTVTVGFGMEAHHPTDITYVCVNCLTEAMRLIKEELQSS